MIPLLNQEQFEKEIWNTETSNNNKTYIIYFTAPWCGACQRLDIPSIRYMLASTSTATAIWYKCDIDENDYTAAYCEIRKIPTFLMIRNKKILSRITSSDNAKVFEWLQQNLIN
jgi:thioredoxin-like negative regulator of GroEL